MLWLVLILLSSLWCVTETLFVYCVLHDDTSPDGIVCGFLISHVLKTLLYRQIPLGLVRLKKCPSSKNAVRPEMASRIRRDIAPCTELAVEELLPMIVPLFFVWQSLARVSPQLFVFLPATCLSTFPLSLQSQRTVGVCWRWGIR